MQYRIANWPHLRYIVIIVNVLKEEMTDTEKAERLEEVIEAATLAESSMQFNFGVDEVFDELVACSGVPDHLKSLYAFSCRDFGTTVPDSLWLLSE